MIRLRTHYARRQDDGMAMLFVIAIGLIVTGFVVVMFTTVLQNQTLTREHRNVTSAQSAAEAGLNDFIYQLGQYTNGVSNWSLFGPSGASAYTSTNKYTQTFGSNTGYSAWITGTTSSGHYIVQVQGTYAGNTRTVRAEVEQASPPAFDYSLFASKGIDIHHHNSSYLSPQAWTTSVHSNGYVNLDYSSEFTVDTVEAVGALTMAKGGGSTPGSSIPTSGYSWYDPLNQKCYPGGFDSPGGTALVSGSCPYKYSGNATIYGTVKAGSVTITSRGQVSPTSAVTLDTGQTIPAADGDVYTGSASINGATFTTTTAGNACNTAQVYCKKGPNNSGGTISGTLHVTPGYAPDTIPFPSIDFSSTYRAAAQKEQDLTGIQHVFTSGTEFLNYITTTSHGFYYTIDPTTHALTPWVTGSATGPDVIYLNGDWDIKSNSLSLSYSNIGSLVHAATSTNGATPIIIVQGSLVAETGNMTLNSGLVVIGAGNRTSFLTPATSTTPVIVDTSQSTGLLDPNATGPGVLAAGGGFNASDYDTDSNWSSSATYEPAKATPIYIRGLVYAASYDSTTGTSTPQNQHWHNYDPKNLMKIYGAQVGGTLHDCNNFSFSYDPLVKLAFGFGGGTVQLVDYQELGQ